MKKNLKIPDSISLRTKYKRKFSLWEMYRAFILIPGSVANMIQNNRSKLVGKDFIERLQLAVTEVNGCAACSYAHTYMALKQGMGSEEIHSYLNGDGKFINKDESKAIIFAQHYADTRAYPKKDAFDSLVNEYGKQKVKIILSAIQLIQAANIYGVPFSAFQSRLKGRRYEDSSLIYEVGILLGGFIILPIALVHGLLRIAMGHSSVRVNNSTTTEEHS